MTIGEKIRALRKQHGMTQTELAEKLNTTKQTIGKYEQGIVTNLPLYRIQEIADIFGVSPEYLTGWSDVKQTDAPADADADLREYLEMLRSRPECRALLSTVKGATKAEVEENVRFIEALRQSRHD